MNEEIDDVFEKLGGVDKVLEELGNEDKARKKEITEPLEKIVNEMGEIEERLIKLEGDNKLKKEKNKQNGQ